MGRGGKRRPPQTAAGSPLSKFFRRLKDRFSLFTQFGHLPQSGHLPMGCSDLIGIPGAESSDLGRVAFAFARSPTADFLAACRCDNREAGPTWCPRPGQTTLRERPDNHPEYWSMVSTSPSDLGAGEKRADSRSRSVLHQARDLDHPLATEHNQRPNHHSQTTSGLSDSGLSKGEGRTA